MKELEVVCAILQNGSKVLIGKRGKGIAEAIWEFPGGKVETNETQKEACIREIKEELELTIEVDGFLCDVVDSAFTPPVHVYAYLAHIVSGEPILHAHTEIQWVECQELIQYQFQEADHEILKRVQAKASMKS